MTIKWNSALTGVVRKSTQIQQACSICKQEMGADEMMYDPDNKEYICTPCIDNPTLKGGYTLKKG